MNKLLVLLLVVCMVFALTSCTNDAPAEEPLASDSVEDTAAADDPYADLQELTMKTAYYASYDNDEEYVGEVWAMHRLEEFWEEKSGGKFKLEVYDGGVMGSDDAVLELVSTNSLQLFIPSSESLASYNNDFAILSLPWITDDIVAFCKELNEGELGAYFANLLDGTGLKISGWYTWGSRTILNSVRPINTPEDMAGIKIRVFPSQVNVDLYNLLGANPTPLDWTELFMALQQGAVDGLETSSSYMISGQMYEVTKYLSLTKHVYGLSTMIYSEDFYNSLNDASKQLFDEGMEYYCTQAMAKEMENEEKNFDLLGEYVEVNEISPENLVKFKEAIAPLYEDYRDQFSEELWQLVGR
ncbi:MAG: TRAP transporter substrate-binding protein [Bacillota bacterium]|nr:TRAP transporter substrate-binding protein [Bacillota bacterium]